MDRVKEIVPLYGCIRIKMWNRQGDIVHHKVIKNAIANVGKDSILKRLGNLSGGGYFDDIGVGDSTAVFDASHTDLQAATNKLWKQITNANVVYVRPTLTLPVTFDFSEANFTWNEFGIRDDSDNLVARQVDASPLTKTNSLAAIAQWEFSL